MDQHSLEHRQYRRGMQSHLTAFEVRYHLRLPYWIIRGFENEQDEFYNEKRLGTPFRVPTKSKGWKKNSCR
jgi:hypothetical protein